MKGEKNSRFTIALIAVSVILLLVVLYLAVVKPAVNGYIIKAQNDGIVYAINTIISQIKQNGYVQIPAGNNQTITLVPYQQNSNAK